MSGRLTPGPSADKLNDLWYKSFTLASDGSPALAVVNTDGSPIASAEAGNLPTVLINNQQTATTSAVALPSGILTQGVVIEALSTNTVNVFVGGSGVTTSTGIELPPGAAVSILISNTNLIYIRCASSSPVVSWVGS